ncbi:MAG: cytochrome c peroxidase [Pirellulales bacterium]
MLVSIALLNRLFVLPTVLFFALACALVGSGDPMNVPDPPASEPVQSPAFGRLAPRPERTSDERRALAARLREVYSGPGSQWPAPQVDDGVLWLEIGLLPAVEHPADNPPSAEKVELGNLLFFDPRLSGSGQMACASCHDPDLGWADGRTTSFGIDRTPLERNAPSIMNSGYHRRLFWDGRAESLEDQARQVLLNEDEMRTTPEELASKLSSIPAYREKFAAAFGEAGINIATVTQAIACFERTIVGGRSRFDSFLNGNSQAMSDEALLGMDLFRREARCMNCHHGALFSDSELHEVGLSYYGRKFEDLGHYRITKRADDVGRFRTPSLRNFGATGPYMHNGLFASTRGVLNMYNAGMPTLRRKADQLDDARFPVKSRHLRPLGLNSQDLGDLEAFLNALTEPYRRIRPPQLPTSQ